MDHKKTTVCLVGAALVVGLVVLLLLAFHPRTSQAVTIDLRVRQSVIDHLPAEIEETVERKSMDGHHLCQMDWVQRRQPEASFRLAIK